MDLGETLPAVDRAAFLAAMRGVPGTVAIIATTDGVDTTGMAATAWNSLCADPPMLLACVNKSASAHSIVNRSRAFSVSVVPTSHHETVAIFSAQRGLNGQDRFLDGLWQSGPGGQPLLTDATAAFECELVGEHSYGTHSIFIGKVFALRRNDGSDPLVYCDGRYARAERFTTD